MFCVIVVTFAFVIGLRSMQYHAPEMVYKNAMTFCGNVQGQSTGSGYEFHHIPYALPPTGLRRWKPPVPFDLSTCWNGILQTYKTNQTHCVYLYPDKTYDGTEGCLSLDVYTPNVAHHPTYPVVVLIGAESPTAGSVGLTMPTAITSFLNKVVFVVMRFRMGIFGFLSGNLLLNSFTQHSGNYALKDLELGLSWVKQNIHHFGGNTNMTTLLGYSVGATIVAALAASDKTNKLFNQAWISNGAGNFPAFDNELNNNRYTQYFDMLNCTDLSCLLEKNVTELMEAVPSNWVQKPTGLPTYLNSTNQQHNWIITDGDFLNDDIYQKLGNEKLPVKLVLGATIYSDANDKLLGMRNQWTSQNVTEHIEASFLKGMGLHETVFKYYDVSFEGLIRMISDIRTVCPLLYRVKDIPRTPFYIANFTANGKIDSAMDVKAILSEEDKLTGDEKLFAENIKKVFYAFVKEGKYIVDTRLKNKITFFDKNVSVDQYTNCDFWIYNNLVPKYARVD